MIEPNRIGVLLASGAGNMVLHEILTGDDLTELQLLDFLFGASDRDEGRVEVFEIGISPRVIFELVESEPSRPLFRFNHFHYREIEFRGKRRNSRLRTDSVRSRSNKR